MPRKVIEFPQMVGSSEQPLGGQTTQVVFRLGGKQWVLEVSTTIRPISPLKAPVQAIDRPPGTPELRASLDDPAG